MGSVDSIQLAVGLVWKIQDSFTRVTETLARTTGRLDSAKTFSLTEGWIQAGHSPLHVISKLSHEVSPEGMSNILHDTQGL